MTHAMFPDTSEKTWFLAGDSLAVGLALPLQHHVPRLVCVARDGRQSWEEQHVPSNATLVLFSLGTNDVDRCAPFGWESTYADRLYTIVRSLPVAHLVWLLPPPMGEPDREFFVDQRRTVIRNVAQATSCRVVEPWPGAAYQEYLSGCRIRDEDGIHFTTEGYALWAKALLPLLQERVAISVTVEPS